MASPAERLQIAARAGSVGSVDLVAIGAPLAGAAESGVRGAPRGLREGGGRDERGEDGADGRGVGATAYSWLAAENGKGGRYAVEGITEPAASTPGT